MDLFGKPTVLAIVKENNYQYVKETIDTYKNVAIKIRKGDLINFKDSVPYEKAFAVGIDEYKNVKVVFPDFSVGIRSITDIKEITGHIDLEGTEWANTSQNTTAEQ
jgi:hypothetical protein